ncbi:probable serine/threonine-protein kinase fhkB isoform X1 [Drosophila virilis]|uniref:Uncharacterized protein, isoform A n=2 Tax=Drosophila virilis TaxID=7244 RepID=B4LGJ6_DROVI|nr:probable basic-leucine zipper transcription factor Q isoform X1 [Drosophila virilis]EDW69434.1 uncharacterized protein Dvir_GJ13232, isoform A [Drosophila virilis]
MDMHRLINEVKQRPALWDASHPEHANRVETLRQWHSVADALGAKVELCRSKWKNLRCSYRRQQHRSQQQLKRQQQASPAHLWSYAEAMSFLDGRRLRSDSSNNEDDDCDLALGESMSFKTESQPTDEMEADNDDLMQQFQSMATPQALRRLSHSISLASAAAEEQAAAAAPTTVLPTPMGRPSAVEAAAASSCHCAKRVDEQVNFLESLEREEQQLIQSTSQDLARCKNILHVGDSDYNFLISFLPLMKQMSPLQNVAFRAKMGELLLQTMQQSQQPQQQQQQQRQPQEEQPQPSQMLLNQQQMALDQAQQVTTSTTNWN